LCGYDPPTLVPPLLTPFSSLSLQTHQRLNLAKNVMLPWTHGFPHLSLHFSPPSFPKMGKFPQGPHFFSPIGISSSDKAAQSSLLFRQFLVWNPINPSSSSILDVSKGVHQLSPIFQFAGPPLGRLPFSPITQLFFFPWPGMVLPLASFLSFADSVLTEFN